MLGRGGRTSLTSWVEKDWGMLSREVVNRPHLAALPGMAVTPDWELGEGVGGLLKLPDPG